jgi:hypothetical protein
VIGHRVPPAVEIGRRAAADLRDRRAAARAEIDALGRLVDALRSAHGRGALPDPETARAVLERGRSLLLLGGRS